jgi:hypothetical protein
MTMTDTKQAPFAFHEFRTYASALEDTDRTSHLIAELTAQLGVSPDPAVMARRDALLIERSDALLYLSAQEPANHSRFHENMEPRDFWRALDAFLADAERAGIKSQYDMPPIVSNWALLRWAPDEGAIELPQRWTMTGRKSEPMP